MATRKRLPALKAKVFGASGDSPVPEAVQKALGDGLSNELDEATQSQLPAFVAAGGMLAPYGAWPLWSLYESSAILRPNVDAYVANIDSNGHRYVPMVDLDSDDADERLCAIIREERRLESGASA